MEFDDEQLPNESSICNMQSSYATNACSATNETAELLDKIDWQANSQILSNMAKHSTSSAIKNYIRGLIELNSADEQQILDVFKHNVARKNPTLSFVGNYNQLFKHYLENEVNLLTVLIQILTQSNKEQSRPLSSIIIRRLEAMLMLANFQTTSFFV